MALCLIAGNASRRQEAAASVKRQKVDAYESGDLGVQAAFVDGMVCTRSLDGSTEF